ncbi:MAG: CHAT domain-containing protein, partial [Gammaproteobacteria bacterium]|nr:CHAT domain-containing protein [Gammaproteobacteria bacterium]
LANLYESQGRYGEAEPLFLRTLHISEQVLGKKHPHILISVNNLAELYRVQGRYSEAEPLLQRTLRVREQVLGKKHPDTIISLNNLALLYKAQGRYGEAEPLYLRALRVSEQVLGKEHPQTLGTVNNLAALYRVQGRYGEAEPLYLRALRVSEQVLGKEHPLTLASINNLAGLYESQGRYAEAEPLYLRALRVSEQVLGKAHPHTMATMQNLTGLQLGLKQPKKALSLLKRLQAGALRYAAVELTTTLGEAQKRRFLSRQSVLQDLALSLAMQYPTPSNQQFAATVLLRWNQVQGEEALFLQRLSRHSGDPRVQALAQQIRGARTELSFLANQKEVEPAALQHSLEKLADLEVKLSLRSRVYKQHLAVRSLDLDTVRSALPHGSALLAFKAYRPFDTDKQALQAPHYLALLLPAEDTDEETLQLLDLGPVDEIIALGLRTDREESGLYRRLFAALDERLEKYDSLYIAPDHWLHLLNFERLRLPDGRYWIERQPLHRLQTARDLVRPPPLQKGKGLLALGGIDYGSPPKIAAGKAQIALTETQRNLAGQLEQGFKPLKASGKEALQIKQFYWTPEYGEGDSELEQVWRGQEAGEHRLKQLEQAPQILHLATHGFYLEDKFKLGRPLVLSGLALANANRGIAGELSHGEDGILYALEVQDLNLEGTLLVSLSACDTGQGAVDYAEGVYGLIRAFRVAGARHVLMTLRKVDDNAAFRFMSRFYLKWLESGGLDNPARALRETKLSFLHGKRPAERKPEMWAPYVLVEIP